MRRKKFKYKKKQIADIYMQSSKLRRKILILIFRNVHILPRIKLTFLTEHLLISVLF